MIKVTIEKGKITAEGHANNNYICNTVSTMMWALSNNLEKANARKLEIYEDDGLHIVACKVDRRSKPSLEGFIECFKLLAEQFPEEIFVTG